MLPEFGFLSLLFATTAALDVYKRQAVHTGITKNGTAQGGYKQIEKIGDYTVVTSSVNYANTCLLYTSRCV